MQTVLRPRLARLKTARLLPFLILCLTLDSWGYPAPPAYEIAGNGFEVRRVAHAGGGVEHEAYTNSIEALNLNYADGFRYFEIDLSWTRDGELVCLHDWGESFQRAFGKPAEGAVTLDEFTALVSGNSEFEKCTLDSLAAWLRYHPDARLISDVKQDNRKALAKIAATFGDAREQVIPQIYQPAEYATVRAHGFSRFIWTLYQYEGDSEDVLQRVNDFALPFAVTMTTRRVAEKLPEALAERGIASYTHTINSERDVLAYRDSSAVSEFYTDFLPVE